MKAKITIRDEKVFAVVFIENKLWGQKGTGIYKELPVYPVVNVKKHPSIHLLNNSEVTVTEVEHEGKQYFKIV